MKYTSSIWDGEVEIGDVVEVKNCFPFAYGYIAPGCTVEVKITRIDNAGIACSIINSPKFIYLFLPPKDDEVIIIRKIRRKPVPQRIFPPKEEFSLKEILYGRQIRQEEQSLPPEDKRPFEFL